MRRAILHVTPMMVADLLKELEADAIKPTYLSRVVKNALPKDTKVISTDFDGDWINVVIESKTFKNVDKDNLPVLPIPIIKNEMFRIGDNIKCTRDGFMKMG